MNIKYVLPQKNTQKWAENSLRDSLALSFSHYVAENIDFRRAKFYTFAKADLLKDSLLDFRSGGKVSGEPHPDDWLIDSLNTVRSKENNFFFVEDWLASPESSFISSFPMPAVFKDKEVYYVAKDNPRRVANWNRICSNTVPLFHGFMIEGEDMPSPGTTLTEQQLEVFAKCVQLIFFGIYDGESYLLCLLRE